MFALMFLGAVVDDCASRTAFRRLFVAFGAAMHDSLCLQFRLNLCVIHAQPFDSGIDFQSVILGARNRAQFIILFRALAQRRRLCTVRRHFNLRSCNNRSRCRRHNNTCRRSNIAWRYSVSTCARRSFCDATLMFLFACTSSCVAPRNVCRLCCLHTRRQSCVFCNHIGAGVWSQFTPLDQRKIITLLLSGGVPCRQSRVVFFIVFVQRSSVALMMLTRLEISKAKRHTSIAGVVVCCHIFFFCFVKFQSVLRDA